MVPLGGSKGRGSTDLDQVSGVVSVAEQESTVSRMRQSPGPGCFALQDLGRLAIESVLPLQDEFVRLRGGPVRGILCERGHFGGVRRSFGSRQPARMLVCSGQAMVD